MGCSDDDSIPEVPSADGGVTTADTSGGETSATGGGTGNASTDDSNVTDDTSSDNVTVDLTDTSSADGSSGASTSEPSSSGATTDIIITDTGASTDGTSGGPIDTTDPITDGAIDPPSDMIVVADFDYAQGFKDGQDNLDDPPGSVVRSYANSLMSLTIPFGSSGDQTGVNFNTTATFCGYDLVARVRLVSGFNTSTAAAGGVQLRAWSDNWGQFTSSWTNVSAVGQGNQLGLWVEYRFTWSAAIAENPSFDFDAVNAVGLAFIAGGTGSDAFSTARFDVDWIGFVPSADACPTDTGSTSGDVDSGVVDTSGDVDSGVVDDTDAGVTDTGGDVDSGVIDDTDAGVTDTGGDVDSGVIDDTDAGVTDTSAQDSGVEDTSSAADAGDDAGSTDSNLVLNGDFEVDTSGWAALPPATLTATAGRAYTGLQSMYVSGGIVGNGPATTVIANPIPGATYNVTLWASVDILISQVRVDRYLDCDVNPTEAVVASTPVFVGWTELTGSFTVPLGCTSTEFSISVYGETLGPPGIYVDDVSVTLAP